MVARMREFILYVDTAEWGIYANGYELWGNKDYDKKRNKKYMFATLCVKDGLIMGFFDISIDDETIKIAKNDELMQETCEFEVLIHDKFKERFSGTFVDALKYAQKAFK